MRNKRVWSLLLALLLAAGLLTGCGAAPETAEQDDRPVLVVGGGSVSPLCLYRSRRRARRY